MHDSSTSRNPLLLAATLYLALLSTADAFVNPSQEAKHHPPRSILMMGYLDALSGSSGINNRGSNGGGGMGSNPPGGSGGGMGSNQPGGGGMGSNPPSTSQSEMPYSTPVTPPPPIGSSNGDYDQRRQGSEFGSTSNMDGGPSYSSYMSGRGHAATSMNGGGGLGMGDNHMHRDTRAGMHNHPNENGLSGSINSQSMNGSSMGRNGMNSGMIHGGMNGQNMPSVGGMNGSGAMSSSHQNALQNNRSGMGGGVNGQDNNMPSNHNSPQTNPYMNSNIVNNNHDSSLANLRGSNMNSIDPSTSKRNMDHRGHEMDHNRNMDMDRRPGYRNDGQPGNIASGTSALAYYGGGDTVDNQNTYYRYDSGNIDYSPRVGFGTSGSGGYPLTLSYDQYGGMRLGGRYYYGGTDENYFDLDSNAGSGYGIRRMGYWDILQHRAKRGRKYTPGTGSRYSGRGVLVDSENMGPRAIGFSGFNQPLYGRNANDQGYYNTSW